MVDKHRQSEVLEAGLKGGTVAAMPGILAGAIADNVKSAPKFMHAMSNKWLTGAVSAAGLGAAALHKAKQVGMKPREAAGLMAGSGGGDAVGGYGGMLVGEEMARAATKSIKNPGLRIAASIGGMVAGDTAGGVAGNLAGGQIAKLIQGKHMQKTAMTTNAPLSEIRKFVAAKPIHKRVFTMPNTHGAAVIKTPHGVAEWHPNDINPNTIAAKKKILMAS